MKKKCSAGTLHRKHKEKLIFQACIKRNYEEELLYTSPPTGNMKEDSSPKLFWWKNEEELLYQGLYRVNVKKNLPPKVILNEK